MTPSLILDTITRGAFPTVMVFSLYLLFTGHNAPGGGFVGGLTAGAALVLRYVDKGPEDVRALAPASYEGVLGVGLIVAGLTGALSWVFGAQFLESGIVKLHPPLLGEVKIVSALFFDIGVYLVVIGLVLGLLLTLGNPATAGLESQEDRR